MGKSLEEMFGEMTPEEQNLFHKRLSGNDLDVEPNQINYFFPEEFDLLSISINSYAGPPAVGTPVYIRNDCALENDPEYDFNKFDHQWVVEEVVESIRVQGRYKDRLLYPHRRTFEVYLIPYNGEAKE